MAVLFIAQILSGLFLIMFYIPNTDMAFSSISFVMRNVQGGWCVRYLHMNGSSFLFFLLYLHIGKGLFYSTYSWSSRLTWWSGYFLFLMNTIISFLGYILPWGQMSFWGLTVITNLVTCLPIIGNRLLLYLWGGFEVSTVTLQRVFVLHYFLPFILLAGIIAHILSMHESSVNNPYGHNQKIINDIKDIPLYPYYIVKDYYYFWVFILTFSFIIFFYPEKFANPVNYIEANPMKTPKHIIPEWYFLPFYSILKAIPSKVIGVCTMVFFIVHPFYIPYFSSMNIPNKYNLFSFINYLLNCSFYSNVFKYLSQKKQRSPFLLSVFPICFYHEILILGVYGKLTKFQFCGSIIVLFVLWYKAEVYYRGCGIRALVDSYLFGASKGLVSLKNSVLGEKVSNKLPEKEFGGAFLVYTHLVCYWPLLVYQIIRGGHFGWLFFILWFHLILGYTFYTLFYRGECSVLKVLTFNLILSKAILLNVINLFLNKGIFTFDKGLLQKHPSLTFFSYVCLFCLTPASIICGELGEFRCYLLALIFLSCYLYRAYYKGWGMVQLINFYLVLVGGWLFLNTPLRAYVLAFFNSLSQLSKKIYNWFKYSRFFMCIFKTIFLMVWEASSIRQKLRKFVCTVVPYLFLLYDKVIAILALTKKIYFFISYFSLIIKIYLALIVIVKTVYKNLYWLNNFTFAIKNLSILSSLYYLVYFLLVLYIYIYIFKYYKYAASLVLIWIILILPVKPKSAYLVHFCIKKYPEVTYKVVDDFRKWAWGCTDGFRTVGYDNYRPFLYVTDLLKYLLDFVFHRFLTFIETLGWLFYRISEIILEYWDIWPFFFDTTVWLILITPGLYSLTLSIKYILILPISQCWGNMVIFVLVVLSKISEPFLFALVEYYSGYYNYFYVLVTTIIVHQLHRDFFHFTRSEEWLKKHLNYYLGCYIYILIITIIVMSCPHVKQMAIASQDFMRYVSLFYDLLVFFLIGSKATGTHLYWLGLFLCREVPLTYRSFVFNIFSGDLDYTSYSYFTEWLLLYKGLLVGLAVLSGALIYYKIWDFCLLYHLFISLFYFSWATSPVAHLVNRVIYIDLEGSQILTNLIKTYRCIDEAIFRVVTPDWDKLCPYHKYSTLSYTWSLIKVSDGSFLYLFVLMLIFVLVLVFLLWYAFTRQDFIFFKLNYYGYTNLISVGRHFNKIFMGLFVVIERVLRQAYRIVSEFIDFTIKSILWGGRFIFVEELISAPYKFITRLKKQNNVKNRYKILFFFSISNFLLLMDTGYWEISLHINNHYFKFFFLFFYGVVYLIGYQKGSLNNYK